MKEFEIWIEGYSITGNSSNASFIGKAMGETFEEACRNFEEPEDVPNPYAYMGDDLPKFDKRKGDKLKLDENRNYPSIWACRLYDNEVDARRSFG